MTLGFRACPLSLLVTYSLISLILVIVRITPLLPFLPNVFIAQGLWIVDGEGFFDEVLDHLVPHTQEAIRKPVSAEGRPRSGLCCC